MDNSLSMVVPEAISERGREAAVLTTPLSLDQYAAWTALSGLPVTITARIGMNRITVRDVMALRPGAVFTSPSPHSNDIPLAIGKVRLAWSEFEVSGRTIGVRITQLA